MERFHVDVPLAPILRIGGPGLQPDQRLLKLSVPEIDAILVVVNDHIFDPTHEGF